MNASPLIALAGLIASSMQTLQRRLEEIMAAMAWERRDLVRVSKQSSSVVSQWLGHGSRPIRSMNKLDAADRIAAASGYAALWIAKGLGPKRVSESPPAVPAPLVERIAALDVYQRAALLDAVNSMLTAYENAPPPYHVPVQAVPGAPAAPAPPPHQGSVRNRARSRGKP